MLTRWIGRLALLVLLALAPPWARAQDPRAPVLGMVDVWVIDGATRHPAAGAQVWVGLATVSPVEWIDVRTTNAAGRLLIGPRPQNIYLVSAHLRKPGGWSSAAEHVMVERGQTARVTLVLGRGSAPPEPRWTTPPRGVLDVVAIDSGTGLGLDGAIVHLLEPRTQRVVTQRTVNEGTARYMFLQPGVYEVECTFGRGSTTSRSMASVEMGEFSGRSLRMVLQLDPPPPPPPPPGQPPPPPPPPTRSVPRGWASIVLVAPSAVLGGMPSAGRGLPVVLTPADRALTPVQLLSSFQGVAMSEGLQPGKYFVGVDAPGYQPVRRSMMIRRGATTHMTIRLASANPPREASPWANIRGGGVVAWYAREIFELVAHARLRLVALFQGGPQLETTADDISQFDFENLPAGRYQLQASKDGVGFGALNLTLVAGRVHTAVVVLIPNAHAATLAPPGVLEGSVLGRGSPRVSRVSGALVSAYDWHAGPGTPPVATATSDEQGRFRFDGLPPNRYRVVVAHPQLGSLSTSVELTPLYGRRVWPYLRG
ncbi:MAG: PEGA domain-containing protein [Phycisphaerae bacterium]|nr:PEGA domain-containing protein [Phycisphaerae bacterium]